MYKPKIDLTQFKGKGTIKGLEITPTIQHTTTESNPRQRWTVKIEGKPVYKLLMCAPALASELAEAREEIERLRGAVKDAYLEGYELALNYKESVSTGEQDFDEACATWQDSCARAALEPAE
ncbi:MAG: hypothetical protein JRE40_04195 [Deltaproteobacteria bacterium]|nr:hypothetical protein [Deltaproteobacteria bacterium]